MGNEWCQREPPSFLHRGALNSRMSQCRAKWVRSSGSISARMPDGSSWPTPFMTHSLAPALLCARSSRKRRNERLRLAEQKDSRPRFTEASSPESSGDTMC